MRSAMVSKPLVLEVLDNTSESGVTELNARIKQCCGSIILRVISMLWDIWRECIGCGLREKAGI